MTQENGGLGNICWKSTKSITVVPIQLFIYTYLISVTSYRAQLEISHPKNSESAKNPKTIVPSLWFVPKHLYIEFRNVIFHKTRKSRVMILTDRFVPEAWQEGDQRGYSNVSFLSCSRVTNLDRWPQDTLWVLVIFHEGLLAARGLPVTSASER